MKKKNEKNELSDDKLEKVSAGQEEKETNPNKAIPDNDPNNRRINPQL